MSASEFEVEPENENVTGRCECCGNVSRAVWGFARHQQNPCAAYVVHWTVGHVPEYGANFDLIVGEWGDGTTADDRCLVSLVYMTRENGTGFMVIDAGPRHATSGELARWPLTRDQVIGQPLEPHVFALCDAICLQDERVAELFGGPGGEPEP